eukprot:147969-Prorocentrum_minimum.AAC.1
MEYINTRAGAFVDLQNDDGCTALWLAAEEGRTATAEALIAAGGDVSHRNKAGSSPLHYAAGKGHTATSEALLAKGANVNTQVDSRYQTNEL